MAPVLLWGATSVVAQVPTAPADGGFIISSPSCSTFDSAGAATSSFRPGDQLILRGSGFPAASLVLVTFRQSALIIELGRFKSNAAGEFTSEPTVLRLPTEATQGPAAIQASTGGPSAMCPLQMQGAASAAVPARRPDPDPVPEDSNPLFVVWGTLLALGGGALTFVTYRRWQQTRLLNAMSKIDKHGSRRRRRMGRVQAPPRLDAESPSPPVLPVGWDSGREPIPVQPAPRRYE